MTATLLDTVFAAMENAPDDDAARLRYYAQLADGELFVLLETEAEGDTMTPRVFGLEDGPVVLVFDSEDRLSAFTGAPAPYAALPGRVIAALLAGQGIGMGVNLGVAPSSYLVPDSALAWLVATLGHGPDLLEARPVAFHAPASLPARLIEGLEDKLARAGGLVAGAWLTGVSYADGRRGHMLAFVDAAPGAEEPLARAAGEALTFSGIEAGEIDVTFLRGTDPAVAALARVGVSFAPPAVAPIEANPQAPGSAPGMDPARPPILRRG